MPAANINTDAIIPIPWMRTAHADLGKGLFAVQRYDDVGKRASGSILNRAAVPLRIDLARRREFRLRQLARGCGLGVGTVRHQMRLCAELCRYLYENAFRNGLVAGIIENPTWEACIAFPAKRAAIRFSQSIF